QEVLEEEEFTFTVHAEYSDDATLVYSASNLPSGASFDPETQMFSWTPGVGQAWEYSPEFVVSDGELTDTMTVQITVTANPPFVTLTADPQTIAPGQSATLSWTSEYAETCTILPSIGEVRTKGSVTVSPAETTTYTITASGGGGTAEKSVTVTVQQPPEVGINADPETIEYGQSATLSWNASNAQNCSISPDIGEVATNGAMDVSPDQTTIYTITATGAAGTAMDYVRVTVQSITEPQPEGSFGARYDDLVPPDATLQSYDSKRFSLINGTIQDSSGVPIEGVSVTVLHHPEYGTAFTYADGRFAIPVEGGRTLTVVYKKQGLITAHRKVEVPWNTVALVDPVVMLPVDGKSTRIELNGDPSSIQTHRSTPVTDEFGQRACTLTFTGDNRAFAVDENGNTIRELSTITVRATEFETEKSMPAILPPTSGYTYCSELSIDEARQVQFADPVVMWVDNFLGFEVGSSVPVGYYDRNKGAWIPSENGTVVRLLDADSDGRVDSLDADGDGLADDLNGNGDTADEIHGLEDPSAYTPGATFWRAEITHFTPWDCNWPYGPPAGACKPNAEGEGKVDCERPEPCTTQTGSFVADRSRIFHEDIPIPGTDMTLHYASSRVSGYKSVIKVPASGETVSPELKRIEVYLEIAGRQFHKTLEPLPDQIVEFKWDGIDFRGKPCYGPKIKGKTFVGFVYDAVYYEPGQEFTQSFAQAGEYVTGVRARQEVTSWRANEIEVDRDNPDVISSGWTISAHHRFYPIDMRKIFKGDGTTGYYSPGILGFLAGGPVSPGFSGDQGPAAEAQLNSPAGIASDAGGSIYIADSSNHRVRKVDSGGIITTVVGSQTAGYGGDDGPAAEAQLRNPSDVAVDDEGNLYIADTGNHCIRKVSSNGIITTLAGTGEPGYSGDDDAALEASLDSPAGIDVDQERNIYIADTGNHCIRKISPSGVIATIAGNGTSGSGMDDVPARQSYLYSPRDVAVDGRGEIYIADTGNHSIRRIDISGNITTVAGNGISDFSGDGAEATEAGLDTPSSVALDRQGNIYIADTRNNRIRKVNVTGVITSLAGDGTTGVKAGVPPKEGWVSRPKGIALDPEGYIYFSVTYPGNYACVFVSGPSELADMINTEGQAYVDSSGHSYIIQGGNLHTATTDSDTQIVKRHFSYDSEGRLISIYDRAMNRTRIERNAEGIATAVISPDGLRTELVVDFHGHLSEIVFPDGGTYSFQYDSGGLMTAETDPMGNRFEHVYDSNGRITDVTDPEGGHWHYSVNARANGEVLTELTTAEGQQTVYLDRYLPSGKYTSLITGPAGDITDYSKSEDGMTVHKSLSCGTDLTVEYGLDPGYRYEYPEKRTLTQPSGLTKTIVEEHTYEDVDNDHVHDKAQTTLTINDKTYTRLADGTSNQKTLTTPEGRTTVSDYNPDTGLTEWIQPPGLYGTDFTYDGSGRVASETINQRQTSYTYDSRGNLSSIIDPQNRVTRFEHDSMGRTTLIQRPDGSSISMTYDKNGNMTVLTNPNLADHRFAYNRVDLRTAYEAPVSGTCSYIYDRDRRLIRKVFPSGKEINNIYDSQYPARLTQVQTPEGIIDYTYLSCGSKIESIIRDEEQIAYEYDGSLLAAEYFSGALDAGINYTHNPDFAVSSMSYAGATENISYDLDGLLTGAGRFQVTRNAESGLPESVTADSFSLTRDFNGYAETQSQSVSVAGEPVSSWNLVFDTTGRITSKTEYTDQAATDYSYTYDEMGRLLTVHKDGALVEEYRYNENGLRIYEMNSQRDITEREFSYSAEDQVLSAGDVSYAYDQDGFLRSRTAGEEVTAYDYSSLGELYGVTLPDGTSVDYVYDPLGRRIAKKVDGSTVEKYLWSGRTRLLAVYDGSGALKMRFEYADGRMPYAMTKNGNLYFLAYDQVGSLKVVSDAAGNIVKQIEYDTFGNIINDTNPAFEVPFGFAGGLHDRDTGLVKFGFRDYDPETGRWTAKDPIGFAGGDTDLYGYCLNDPVNEFDPEGLMGAKPAMKGSSAYSYADLSTKLHTSAWKFMKRDYETWKNTGIKNEYSWGHFDWEKHDQGTWEETVKFIMEQAKEEEEGNNCP
ncbi:MAG: putative Ig domain-containing protein, partial [Desulfobacteraceae bacterium]|nr:putative Ig domain-containing protein [Desulfobacteraceae bacterium]